MIGLIGGGGGGVQGNYWRGKERGGERGSFRRSRMSSSPCVAKWCMEASGWLTAVLTTLPPSVTGTRAPATYTKLWQRVLRHVYIYITSS